MYNRSWFACISFVAGGLIGANGMKSQFDGISEHCAHFMAIDLYIDAYVALTTYS